MGSLLVEISLRERDSLWYTVSILWSEKRAGIVIRSEQELFLWLFPDVQSFLMRTSKF